MLHPDTIRSQRAQGMCESRVWRGPRAGKACLFRARWKRRHAVVVDGGMRVCGIHARAYTRESLVEIGTPGWAAA